MRSIIEHLIENKKLGYIKKSEYHYQVFNNDKLILNIWYSKKETWEDVENKIYNKGFNKLINHLQANY